ncbi:hypothetical protein [Lactococcus garvieae]|uniref:hypothetical protein n=1 Tax=Lactococcus garvieae TaxID=1363 RepID=UPI00398ECC36
MENEKIEQLMAKEWGRNMSLISYFEVGEEFIDLVKFITYRNSKGNYLPAKGELNMVDAEIGTRYTLFLEKTTHKVFLSRILSGDINKNLLETVTKLGIND